MKRIRRWRSIFVLASGVVAAVCLWLAFNSHWIRIESVQIDLQSTSTEDLLFQRIKSNLTPQFQHFAGRFFWEVPLTQVYDLTLRDKRVRKVSVYREFPSKLRVEIEPHTPVLEYLSSDNRLYPVAADGTLLPALTIFEAPDLPILRGDELKDEQKLRVSALELFEQIPIDGTLRKKNVSEIFYNRKEGFKLYASGSAIEVKVGDADFGPKISRIEKVLSYLESQNIKGRVIDARFSKKVVVRVRNSP
jgi:cell division septal protein FtsQ